MADPLALRVMHRYMEAFKHEPKETKQHRVEKLTGTIRDATGVSRGIAGAIADAIVRGRDWLALRIQKNWPIDDEGNLEGPRGTLDLNDLAMAKTASNSDIKDRLRKEILGAYEDPEKNDDLEDRIKACDEIRGEIAKGWPRLERSEREARQIADKIENLAREDFLLPWDLKETLEAVRTAASAKLTLAAQQYRELADAFKLALDVGGDRTNELLDIGDQAERELAALK